MCSGKDGKKSDECMRLADFTRLGFAYEEPRERVVKMLAGGGTGAGRRA